MNPRHFFVKVQTAELTVDVYEARHPGGDVLIAKCRAPGDDAMMIMNALNDARLPEIEYEGRRRKS